MRLISPIALPNRLLMHTAQALSLTHPAQIECPRLVLPSAEIVACACHQVRTAVRDVDVSPSFTPDVTPSFSPAGIRAGRLFCASARLKQWAA